MLVKIVFRVPYRDWNRCGLARCIRLFLVFRVPYRDWNSLQHLFERILLFWFLEYLTGIETQIWATISSYKEKVFRVPYRDWNSFWCNIIIRLTIKFLEYLTGIETSFYILRTFVKSWFLEYLTGIETLSALRLPNSTIISF